MARSIVAALVVLCIGVCNASQLLDMIEAQALANTQLIAHSPAARKILANYFESVAPSDASASVPTVRRNLAAKNSTKKPTRLSKCTWDATGTPSCNLNAGYVVEHLAGLKEPSGPVKLFTKTVAAVLACSGYNSSILDDDLYNATCGADSFQTSMMASLCDGSAMQCLIGAMYNGSSCASYPQCQAVSLLDLVLPMLKQMLGEDVMAIIMTPGSLTGSPLMSQFAEQLLSSLGNSTNMGGMIVLGALNSTMTPLQALTNTTLCAPRGFNASLGIEAYSDLVARAGNDTAIYDPSLSGCCDLTDYARLPLMCTTATNASACKDMPGCGWNTTAGECALVETNEAALKIIVGSKYRTLFGHQQTQCEKHKSEESCEKVKFTPPTKKELLKIAAMPLNTTNTCPTAAARRLV